MIRTISINDAHSMDMLQEQRDHSEPPEYWEEDPPPTWGDELWEEQLLDRLAANFAKDGGSLDSFKANVSNIAMHISEQRKGVIEGHAWEYLAEVWLAEGGGADDFLRLHRDLSGWVLSNAAMYGRF